MTNLQLRHTALYYLPVVLFLLLFKAYFETYYCFTLHVPRTYENWGYLSAFYLFLVRTYRAVKFAYNAAYPLLSYRVMAYDVLTVLVLWLLSFHILAVAALMRDFRHNELLHIFLLLFASLWISRQGLMRRTDLTNVPVAREDK